MEQQQAPGVGSLPPPKPPEGPVIVITKSGHVVEDVNNETGTDDRERKSRSSSRSSSVGGGGPLGPLDALRKTSAERRKRDRENAKAQEVDAFQGIVRECKTVDIATNAHLIQMRIDQGKIRDTQQDAALAMASLNLFMNKMSLQMDQLVAMGKQAKTTLEDLKSGDVTLNDTVGLQNCIQGLQQQMKEDFKTDLLIEGKRIEGSVENCINNAVSSPPTKRPRRNSPGRRQTASGDSQTAVADVEMAEVET